MSALLESQPRLTVRTVALSDTRDLLGHLPRTAPLAWLHQGEGLVAWGTAARLTLPAETDGSGTQRFTAARDWLSDLMSTAHIEDSVGLAGCGPVAFGSFTFDPASAGSVLRVPRVVVGRRGGRRWLTTITEAPTTPQRERVTDVPQIRFPDSLRWHDGTLDGAQWCAAVTEALRHIRHGTLDKIVLARDMWAHADESIDARALLARLAADFADCYVFSVSGMVGASPELLIRRSGDAVTSRVLAGTRPRGATAEEDEKLAAELAGSIKDVEEHRYAVDSLRETLAPLCADITMPPDPEPLRLRNVQHLATPVHATLLPGASTLDVVAAMHPTAAVGGTPTAAAMPLIRRLEGMDRGRYAGPVGWIDAHGNGEWAIALRCAELDGRRARLFAGCGIVAGSEPAAELVEAESKFAVMRHALAG